MRNLLLTSVSVIICLTSCMKDSDSTHVETTTSGSKWTLQIGSPAADVYAQLQSLGTEKAFNTVAIVSRLPYAKPQDIQNQLGFYNAITLQSSTGIIDRALIQFTSSRVSSVEGGSSLLDSLTKWPLALPDEEAILVNDTTSQVYGKLLGIYQHPEYSGYQIILPDKPLDLSYDADMANYDEWAFDFSESITAVKTGTHSVRLYFSNRALIKIRDEYRELTVTP